VKRIGLVVHPRRDLDRPLERIRAWAAAHGVEVAQVPMAGVERVVADATDADSCDVIVALGGDGTTLAALHAAAPRRTPVLGVACGSLGALTATSADQVDEALDAFVAGGWHRRRLPGVTVAGEGEPLGVAINDFVVMRKGASQVAVAIAVDGDPYVDFAGDGIVIATPLGSSAYTMAAGGPVIAPGVDAIVLTPLAPHGGSCPPLVVGRGSEVTVAIESGYYGARIERDGHVQELLPAQLTLSWRPDYATLVAMPGTETVFEGLRRRRILMDSPRVQARKERAEQ
jgi:NAD+ kinase